MMRGGERVKEFLRPFVDSREWDFCVIWKLGDDPSRYLTLALWVFVVVVHVESVHVLFCFSNKLQF